MTIDAQRFLLAIRDQLVGDIVPELRGGRADVAERAGFSALLLGRIVADRYVFPKVAMQLLPRFEELSLIAERVFSSNAALSSQCLVSRLAVQSQTDPLASVDLFRDLLVNVLREIDDKYSVDTAWNRTNENREQIASLATKILALDCDWRQGCTDALVEANRQHLPRSSVHTAQASKPLVTAESCTDYLRRRLPDRPTLRVQTVKKLSGGRSKHTYLLMLENQGDWPCAIVMRQDTGHDLLPTTVCDEFEPIQALTDHGVRLPRPLILEGHDSDLGKPFFLMEKMDGSPSGDYYRGLFEQDSSKRRSIALDVAAVLGRLHSVDPMSAFPGVTPIESFARTLSHYKRQWRQYAVEQSPMIEYAFHWLEKECAAGFGAVSVVHGDVAVHNILVQEGKVTALIDWELVHVGDPAEDLAYVRPIIESAVNWRDFMDAYRTAGGGDVDELRLKIFAVWGFIRNAAVAAAGGDRFRRDHNADLELGFMGTATAYLEQQLIPLFAGPSLDA